MIQRILNSARILTCSRESRKVILVATQDAASGRSITFFNGGRVGWGGDIELGKSSGLFLDAHVCGFVAVCRPHGGRKCKVLEGPRGGSKHEGTKFVKRKKDRIS